jgi:hypothetical protein
LGRCPVFFPLPAPPHSPSTSFFPFELCFHILRTKKRNGKYEQQRYTKVYSSVRLPIIYVALFCWSVASPRRLDTSHGPTYTTTVIRDSAGWLACCDHPRIFDLSKVSQATATVVATTTVQHESSVSFVVLDVFKLNRQLRSLRLII